MGKFVDLTGRRSGMLTVIRLSDKRNKYNKPLWECMCDCQIGRPEGEIEYVYATSSEINMCSKKSCGCLKEERLKRLAECNRAKKERRRKEVVGQVRYNASGCKMTLIEYNWSKDVVVEFDDEFKFRVHVSYSNFDRGHVKNPYEKIFFGKGYEGVGKYEQHRNNKVTKEYEVWSKMLTRCYDEKYHKRYPTYVDCEVCEEWLNFQNFAEWYNNNSYELPEYPTQLDKDWLVYGNKVYSPDTCVLVPSIINKCILDHCRVNDSDVPKGLSLQKKWQISSIRF